MGKSHKKKSRSQQSQVNSSGKAFGLTPQKIIKEDRSVQKVDLLLHKGIQYYQSGNYNEAKVCFDQAAKLQSSNSEAWYLLGATSVQLGDYYKALKELERAIQLVPHEAKYYCHLGNAWCGLGEFKPAIAAFQDAIRLQPDHLDSRFNLGNAFLYQRQFPAAAIAYREVLRLDPQNFHAWNNLGHALFSIEQYDEAIAAFEKTLKLDPSYLEAHLHIGNVFQMQERYEEAMALYQSVLEKQPNTAGSYNNIANIFKKQGRFAESITAYEKSLQLNSHDPAIHLNIALELLLLGEFARGWEEHEWRLQASRVIPKALLTPVWQGKNSENKEILLWSEQGLGDGIQFVRYAILLQEQGYQVTVATRVPLISLFKHCLEPKIQVIDQDSSDLANYQNHNSLMGLPRLFRTNLQTIPHNIPYLFAPTDIPEALRLPETSYPKIGLVWAGGTINQELYRSKSINLEDFLQVQQEFLDAEKISFWSLQVGEDAKQIEPFLNNKTVFDITPSLNDFLDTASVIEQLDLIITVDTAVAHLAGAMGKSVWLILPFVPDWRWLLDREDSPWYPTIKLFRQAESGNWQQIFLDIKTQLNRFIEDGILDLPTIDLSQQTSKKNTLGLDFSTGWHDARIHYDLGKDREAKGDFVEAIAKYQQALKLCRDNLEIYNALGNALHHIGDLAEAEKIFQQATNVAPSNASLHYNLGNTLLLQGKYEAAISVYDQSLKLNPQDRGAWNNQGHALLALERYEEAIHAFQQILTFLPEDAETYSHIGNVLQTQGKYEEAIAFFRQAFALEPDNTGLEYNLGNGLQHIGHCTEAIEHYRHVLSKEPNNKKAHFNLGWSCLLTGNYQEGWQGYEWRFNPPDASDTLLPTSIWDGTVSSNQHLLLWSEQGFGDCIQFIRYAALCLAKNQKVTVATRQPLIKLFRECLDVKIDVVNQDQMENIEQYTAHAPLMSLPNIFQSTKANIPQTVPYLNAPVVIPAHLKLPPTQGKKIGIVWGSNAKNTKMYQEKSIDLGEFFAVHKSLLDSQQITFWSLQVGEDAATIQPLIDDQTIYDVSPLLKDFCNTASIIEQLDLVITIDTAVAHLAGAMGKPVWVMLPQVPDWRWLLDGEDSLWYPTMQLFRQSTRGNWQDVFEAICEQLTAELLFAALAPQLEETIPKDAEIEDTFDNVLFYRNIADGLAEQGRFDEAIATYQKIIEQDSNNPELHNAIGIIYTNQNNFEAADQYFQQAITLKPDRADSYFNRGNIYLTQEKYDDAITFYEQAIQLDSFHSGAYNNLSIALIAQQKNSEALDVLNRFLPIAEDKASIYNQIGNMCYGQKDYQGAIAAFRSGLELLENNTAFLYNLGNALQKSGECDAAIEAYQKILLQTPDDVNVHFNYGCALQKQGKFTEAIAVYQKVVKMQPDHAGAYCNLGCSLQANAQIELAIEAYQKVVELEPDNPGSHSNLAITLLLLKHFERGWQEYEWRLKTFSAPNKFAIWQGEPINSEETLLLWSEQGFGDSLQFIRYAAVLQAQGYKITIATSKPLMRLFENCIDLPIEIVNIDQDDVSSYRHHIPLMSLPKVLETKEDSIPNTIPYILPPSDIPSHLKLPNIGNLKMGLVWASSVGHSSYSERASNAKHFFDAFADLLDLSEVSFWSLQVGKDTAQIQPWSHHTNVIDPSPLLKDFYDTATVIEQLDLVITIDTSVAHLAGAMGKKVWVLLHFSPDWRWQLDRLDSPWYPTARLFRQQKQGDWTSVLQQVHHALKTEFKLEPAQYLATEKKINSTIDMLEDSNSAFYIALAHALAEQDRTEEAIAAYLRVIESQPDNVDILNSLGCLYQHLQKFDNALDYFKKGLHLDPSNTALLFNCGNILFLQEKYAEAILHYKKSLKIKSDDAGTYHHLALALEQLDRYEEAIAAFQTAVQLFPDHVDIGVLRMKKAIKLHLGCGHKIMEGYINVDKFGEPDINFDLETFPWPWEDNSVDEVIMHHVLEHLGQSTDIYLKIIQELYRVCQHGAVIDIRVPHHRHDHFIIDPTHVRIITPEGLGMFSKKANLQWKEAGVPTTTLGLYLDVDFEISDLGVSPTDEWMQKLKNKEITEEELFEAGKKFNNVYGEVHIKMVAIKE